jgi:hypothetical protein
VLAALLVGGDAVLPVNSVPRLAIVVGVALVGYVMTYVTVGAGATERAAFESGARATMRLGNRLRPKRFKKDPSA